MAFAPTATAQELALIDDSPSSAPADAPRVRRATASRASRENSGSVTIEIAVARRANIRAMLSTSGFSTIDPADGDADLISAMT